MDRARSDRHERRRRAARADPAPVAAAGRASCSAAAAQPHRHGPLRERSAYRRDRSAARRRAAQLILADDLAATPNRTLTFRSKVDAWLVAVIVGALPAIMVLLGRSAAAESSIELYAASAVPGALAMIWLYWS